MLDKSIIMEMGKGAVLIQQPTPEQQSKIQHIAQQLAYVQELFHSEENDLIAYNRAWSVVPEIHEDYMLMILKCAHDIRDNFEAFVTVGIGGSDLCARLFHELLNPPYYQFLSKDKRYGAPEVYFTGDTFDPRGLYGLLDSLKQRNLVNKTIFHIVSKSGRTGETFGSAMLIRRWLEENGQKDWRDQFIVTTGVSSNSVLYMMHKDAHFRHVLPMPDGVGGRFSAFTAVGLLLLAATAGCSETPEERLKAALDGIEEADDLFRLPYYHDRNIAYRLAGWLHQAEAVGKSIMEFYDYADQRFLADWFVQLYDESVQERGQGLTARPLRGPTCNHSALNGIINGPRDKVVLFLRWLNLFGEGKEPKIPIFDDIEDPELSVLKGLTLSQLQEASYGGTAEDFTDKGIPNVTLSISGRDVKSVCALLRILMDTVAVKGRLQGLHLNSAGLPDLRHELTYLQDGVEGYKIKTLKIARKMQEKHGGNN